MQDLSNSTLDDPGGLKNCIAIVGMSCRFPGANNADEFWDVLISGQDHVTSFPAGRPVRTDVSLDEPGFQAGFLKCPIDEFDASFFGISAREAPYMDPQQRILLEVIWESLESACINPHSLRESKTGVFLGIWTKEYDTIFPNSGLTPNEAHHRYIGNEFSGTSTRVSFFLGLQGPNIAVETGCSSSLLATCLACESLTRGETKLAIASGVNLVLFPKSPMQTTTQGAAFLSTDFRCKAFDESANGFVRAEGCAALVLKRYGDAIKDGDNILGVIRGWAVNNDGPGVSMGTPNAKAQEEVIRDALAKANLKPDEVSLVEAHGTGTAVGDPTEMYSIGQVYSENRKYPLLISSVKTNIGHTESCAGMAGLVKVLLCMKHRQVPPHLHLKKLNTKINLEKIPAIIPLQPTTWTGSGRLAAINSFGMTGTNVHVIVQEPPKTLLGRGNNGDSKQMCRQLVTLSARSSDALTELRHKFICHLDAKPTLSLSGIALSLNTGRANFPHRLAVIAKDTEQFVLKLKNRGYVGGKTTTNKQKLIFLFTGQGSQYFGMGKTLYESCMVFRKIITKHDILFRKHLSVGLCEVLWEDPTLIQKTIYCQPAIFCFGVCLCELWESFGILPDFVLGHSTGEFCAAVCAGVLSVEDALKIVIGRSQLVASLPRGSMLALQTSLTKAERLISEFQEKFSDSWIDIAAVNSCEEVVVSGDEDNASRFFNFCEAKRYTVKKIDTSHGYHSRQMDPILYEYGKLMSDVIHKKGNCGYISGTFAREMHHEDFGPRYWQRYLRDTVRFEDAANLACTFAPNGTIFIEIGAQPVLLGLVMRNSSESLNAIYCPSLRRNEDEVLSMLNLLSKLYVAGIDISWQKWFEGSEKLGLPTYPFQRQKFWYTPRDAVHHVSEITHPILGRNFPSPCADKIFYQLLDVNRLQYLQDHKIAGTVILPAAGFLEIIMAAGIQTSQGLGEEPQSSFTVENMKVNAALVLDKPVQLQTIVHSVDEHENSRLKISVYKSMVSEKSDKWALHVSGIFHQNNRQAPRSRDITTWLDTMTLVRSVNKAYKTAANVGYHFGPRFQCITRAWANSENLVAKVILPHGSASYVCHPIIIDAMIQTFALRFALGRPESSEIHLELPMRINEFTFFSCDITELLYVSTTFEDCGLGVVTLYNENGTPLAVMEGIELVRTTANNFLASLKEGVNDLPEFMKQAWKPRLGISHLRVDTTKFHTSPSTCVLAIFKEVEENLDYIGGCNSSNDKLLFLYLLRAVLLSKWKWDSVGRKIVPADWSAFAPPGLRIVKTDALLKIFESYSYLESRVKGEFKIMKKLPTLAEIEDQIVNEIELFKSIAGEQDVVLQFAIRMGTCLPKIFQGTMTPLEYAFPSDQNEIGVLQLYKNGYACRYLSRMTTSLLVDSVSAPIHQNPGILRILEVGAGSGITCQLTSDELNRQKLPFQYTFTDISATFFLEAKKQFGDGVNYAVFDIENDPLTQGFCPEQFDAIVATNVIHATKNIAETLRNLRQILRPNGILVLGEMFVSITINTLSVGFLDGWWSFDDFRTEGPLINQEQWKNCLISAGFVDVKTIEIFVPVGCVIGRRSEEEFGTVSPMLCSIDQKKKLWLFFSDSSEVEVLLKTRMFQAGRNVLTNNGLEVPSRGDLEGILFFWTVIDQKFAVNQEKCTELLAICQKIISTYEDNKQKPKVFLVTRGVEYIGDASQGNPNAATAHAFLKSFQNEHADISVTILDADQNKQNVEKEADEIFSQLWSNDNETLKAIRGEEVYVRRLVPAGYSSKPIQIPDSNSFKVLCPPTKSLQNLEVTITPKAPTPIGDNIEVSIKATGLNFRDIFMILQPDGFDQTGLECNPGIDISGVVSQVGCDCVNFKVGDEVYGMAPGNGLASHVTIPERTMMRKVPEITFPAAATIPCPFVTAYQTLNLVNIKASDRILIHVASGGVGLAAIQVAKEVGAQIYATVGSRRKRAYLRSIGIQHIYNSRNIKFGDKILKETNGKGVNVVLNSLTGPNFKETSLSICARGARFVEIANVNIWTSEEVAILRPDVYYMTYQLWNHLVQHSEEYVRILGILELKFIQRIYEPLPYEQFPLDRIRQAFHYFQEAKHIGKVVVNIPQKICSPQGQIKLWHALFHYESTYLITGGHKGIGLEVAKWMSTMGAKNILLAGRNYPTKEAEKVIENLNNSGCRTIFIATDVAEFPDCESLLAQSQHLGFPPLRGIIHAAGFILDALITNQTSESFRKVFKPKVQGTWNLHRLTLDRHLEFFLMLSSIAPLFGSLGQSNYAAANGFINSFAHYRHSIGLPAATINFGPWSQVGILANNSKVPGFRYMNPAEGIASIQKFFHEHIVQAAIAKISDVSYFKQKVRLGHYLDELKTTLTQTQTTEMKPGNPDTANLMNQLRTCDPKDQTVKVEAIVEKVLKEILTIQNSESILRDQNFYDVGVDSLMAMEIRNRLQLLMRDTNVPLRTIQENPTISALSQKLIALMNINIAEKSDILDAMIAQDSILPPEIQAGSSPPCKPSQFKNVLLTGATGFFGVHFIQSIQKQYPQMSIHCIVRSDKIIDVSTRLEQNLKRFQIWDKTNIKNLRMIPGDLVKENFGLSNTTYEELTENIDAIIHCASKANHVEEYDQAGPGSLRLQNVVTTLNVLKFAGTLKTKHIFYSSSILASVESNRKIVSGETQQTNSVSSQVRHGYALSKLISEKLILQAMERGIPATIFRIPILFGQHDTGLFLPHQMDHLWSVLLECFRVELFPDLLHDGIPVLCVDTAANICTRIFFQDSTDTGMYTFSCPCLSFADIKEAFHKFGKNVEICTFKVWRDRVFDGQEGDLKYFKPLYEDIGDEGYKILRLLPIVESFNAKLSRNYSGIESEILHPRILLERQLQFHLNQCSGISDNQVEREEEKTTNLKKKRKGKKITKRKQAKRLKV